MKGLNKAMLIGRLGRDPEIRSTTGGTKVATLSLATDYNLRNKTTGEWETKTEWHRIVAWDRLAENAERYLQKGKLIYVEGRITYRSYQDRDGNTRYTTEIVANDLIMLERRDAVDGAPAGSYSQKTTNTESNGEAPPENENEDIPF